MYRRTGALVDLRTLIAVALNIEEVVDKIILRLVD
jgi:hypothetical protein